MIIADYRKDSEFLGTQWKKGVPIEVVPMAYVPLTKKLAVLGGQATLRMAAVNQKLREYLFIKYRENEKKILE